ncbi:type II secretion system F family protein [Uliginosibacterium aquaticum]|uniref:Type II secretion system F family protein n=1 Tax=Uliginosibacterium aquaticum TaxID=2731212 RepID=A0ABX2IKW2_9RHOO|nr:type II secretion system F family protein [Uliginosibacterium aquaticum]NSL54735.1 type II secretion system F family protein [Uliginosibacterium aquaticum]
MDTLFLFFGIAVFVAVVLGLESGFIWWNTTRGPEAKRIERRLRAASAGAHNQSQLTILKQRALSESSGLERMLLLLPRVHQLDRTLLQSGATLSVADFVGLTALMAALGFFGTLLLARNFPLALLLAVVCAVLPSLHVIQLRAKRLVKIEAQLPDAIDLMARAMRAGHAFPTALQMVGDEMSEPVGAEFRVLFDEINYGVDLRDALLNLLSRVPSTDLRYFVVAVLIQRETGGNLAELLDSISAIVRERLKLMGEVRTLSAEGRMSAWILGMLPFAVGLAIQISNPSFLSVLWTDPFGLKLVYGAACMMLFGAWWMRRIIRIRV